MNKKRIILLIILVVILAIALIRFNPLTYSGEDSWIKNEKGAYVKHGDPSETPDYVLKQQQAIEEAVDLYNETKSEGTIFLSQCLGSTGDYAVDIVHVPRSDEDNKPENQCQDFINKKVSHFIELDKDGNIVRIV